MEQLQLAPFDLTMLQECIELYIKTFSKEPWFETNNKSDVERYYLNMYQNNKFIGYVYKNNERIIAQSIGFLKAFIKGEEYYIDQFCVDYNYQGKGLGSCFMDEIKKDLIKKDIHYIILTTEPDYPAYDFYIKNGLECLENLRFLATEL